MDATNIVNVIISSVTAFVTGLGSAFLNAFQTIFMVETSTGTFEGLNPLGIFILVFFGISLGYGVIRWITGLFRREAR